MARILMLVATAVANDSRVRREAEALVAAGHNVHIIGKDVPEDFVPALGITVSSVGATSPFRSTSGAGRQGLLVRAARWWLLPRHRNASFRSWAQRAIVDAKSRDFDVVHAHDFTALQAGAELASERGVPYVYDSHEIWLQQDRQFRPTPWQDRRERQIEGSLGSGAAAVITVGEGVAQALTAAYGWSHVIVVRNTFPVAAGSGQLPQVPRALVYAGRIDGQRDLLTVLATVRQLPDLPVRLIGPVDESWHARHRAEFSAAKVTVVPALPLVAVTAELQQAGLALVTLGAGPENHSQAMPNKLFHAVQAGVPVIASDLPELARVVNHYGLGELYRSGDVADLIAAVRRAQARYPELVANVKAAQSELSWSADSAVLVACYERIGLGTFD